MGDCPRHAEIHAALLTGKSARGRHSHDNGTTLPVDVFT